MKKLNLFLILAATATLIWGFIFKNTPEKIQTGNVVGTEIGNMAPDLNFKNPEGKTISLASLKGKIVLVDFWASWCGPCRIENPNVVAVYNKYKEAKLKNAKGFAIYNISLDQHKEAWLKAIEKDKLSWPTHVSDLKGWQSEPAGIYGVTAIPMNFLLDSRGVIIAKNLRGQLLEQELQKLVVK